jgi:hypothetical protein
MVIAMIKPLLLSILQTMGSMGRFEDGNAGFGADMRVLHRMNPASAISQLKFHGNCYHSMSVN